MIRYRTRDLTRIIPEPCACGRTLRRIDRISARSDDMFIIRGVNIFPSQIESAFLSVDSAALPHYRITLTRRPVLPKGHDSHCQYWFLSAQSVPSVLSAAQSANSRCVQLRATRLFSLLLDMAAM